MVGSEGVSTESQYRRVISTGVMKNPTQLASALERSCRFLTPAAQELARKPADSGFMATAGTLGIYMQMNCIFLQQHS